MLFPLRHPSEDSTVPGLTGAQRVVGSFVVVGLFTVLHAVLALAGTESEASSVTKGVLLVASPAIDDPNFHQTVVLIVEHGSEGTLGIILNRSTDILLSKALPDLAVLKETTYRLFAGGPVNPNRFLMLLQVKEPPPDAQLVFDGVYVGGSPEVLEGIITQAKTNETFRVFAGYAQWFPGQLAYEMLQGAWATLPPDAIGILDQDPVTLWRDCLRRLQTPRVISNHEPPLF